jgi:hypothetical protein
MSPELNNEVLKLPPRQSPFTAFTQSVADESVLAAPGNNGTTVITGNNDGPVITDPLLPLNPVNSSINAVITENGNDGNNNTNGVSQPETPGYSPPTPPALSPSIPAVTNVNNETLTTDQKPVEVDEGLTMATFKLPNWVLQSMEQTAQELNKNLPLGTKPWTRHSYGVEVLTNHEQYRNALQQLSACQTALNEALQKSNDLSGKLAHEQQQSARLKEQLDRVLNELHSRSTTPVDPSLTESIQPSIQQPESVQETVAVTRQESPVDEAMLAKYDRLSEDYHTLYDRLQKSEKEKNELWKFVNQLPGVLDLLYAEASALSWVTKTYFKWYFEQCVQLILPK